MEHFRTDGHTHRYQWCDDQLCMVIDKVTGKAERAFNTGNSIGTFEEAKKYVGIRRGWEDRMIIVKLDSIAAFKL